MEKRMRLRISLEAQKRPGLGKILSRYYDQAWEQISEFYHDPAGIDSWTFAVNERAIIGRARHVFEECFPDAGKPVYEVLCFPEFSEEELNGFGYFVFSMLGDDASGLDALDTAEAFENPKKAVCTTCGNLFQPEGEAIRIRGKRLRKNRVLFTFFRELSTFCRPKFKDSYDLSGLSGLSFECLPDERSGGVPLFKVDVARHEWSNSEGLCESCGMKTNVRHSEFFNLGEDYRHDFQRVLTFDRHYYVLSRSAVDFLATCTHMTIAECHAPISPGTLIDDVYPESRMFTHGKQPTRVLRCTSWVPGLNI